MNALLVDPSVRLYAACAAVLALKMLLTANFTGILRTSRGVFSSPEDYSFLGREPKATHDEQIERVRRAHQNDLENILPFFAVGFVYALTGPSTTMALVLFLAFTIGRLAHTVVYIAGLQPWRTVTFAIAQVAMYVMAVSILVRVL